MSAKFFGKNPLRRVIRRIPNSAFTHRVESVEENKEIKTDKDMADERLQKIEKITGMKAPKRTVKREKKEKGLIERTENSTILLTEDNKMLLND